jgi:hypothetical protein
MKLRTTVDVSEAVRGLDELQKSQLPFAIAATLTGCAKAGQRAVQQGLGGKFTLRNSFTKQGIRITPAEKKSQRIEADVHTHLETPGHPDYMVAQQEGAQKVPWGGHHYIAVPTKYAHQLGGRIIAPELRIGSIMQNLGNVYENDKAVRGLKRTKRMTPRALVFFVQDLRNGHKAVMARYFQNRDAVPIYLLIPEARINPRLEMDKTVRLAVEAAFPGQWKETWRRIMVRGLRIKA